MPTLTTVSASKQAIMGHRKRCVRNLKSRIKQGIAARLERRDWHLDLVIIILLFTVTMSTIFWLIVVFEDVDEYDAEDVAIPVDSAVNKENSKGNECPCANVLEYGTKGKWIREKAIGDQVIGISDIEIRRKLNLPDQMHREDVRCGISYPVDDSALPSSCDPKSVHYCCNEATSWCGNESMHCTGTKSVNYREFVPHQNAVWKQDEHRCSLEDFTPQTACKIFSENGYNLIFVGDSNARKFLASFLLFLSGNFSNGLLHSKLSEHLKQNCSGELQIHNPNCRHVIYDSSILLDKNEACDFESEFLLEYFADFNTFVTKRTEERIKSLFNITNTFVILNAGAHFNAYKDSFINYYLKYISGLLKNVEWPKIIVESLPRVPTKAINEKRISFRDGVKKFCQDNKVLFLDNYDLSQNLLPFDGKHFGMKYFLLKVNILLNFLKKQGASC